MIDRIDRMKDGRIEIIDYKSGRVDIKKWLGKRPEEAQMPAYVLSCQSENVSSVSYSVIKTGSISRHGVKFDDNDLFQHVFFEENELGTKDKTKYILLKENLIDINKSLVEQWQKNLENITKKIISGAMPVSPKKEIDSCRYCDYGDFCRIDEPQPDEASSRFNSLRISNE